MKTDDNPKVAGQEGGDKVVPNIEMTCLRHAKIANIIKENMERQREVNQEKVCLSGQTQEEGQQPVLILQNETGQQMLAFENEDDFYNFMKQ